METQDRATRPNLHPTANPIGPNGFEIDTIRLIRCPDCGQMEWWTEAETQDHGKCRANPAPCQICS